MIKVCSYVAVTLLSLCTSCSTYNSNTPTQYKNFTKVPPSTYKVNKKILHDSIQDCIKHNILAYFPKEYDLFTQIIIDTIVYSPQQNKAAFLVVTKNSNDKLLSKGNKTEYHYDGHCFIASIKNDSTFSDIYWVGLSSISNFHSFEEASFVLRKMFFNDLNKREDSIGNSLYKYNLDDIRFWEGPVWMEMEADKINNRAR